MFFFFFLTNPDAAGRLPYAHALLHSWGCGVLGAAGILLLKTQKTKKKPKTFHSLEQPRMSAAVSHQNQFKKQSLQNMLIHADRCSTAVTTRRLRCLAEGLYNGKWKGGWQSGFIKEQGGLELHWRGKERVEEERAGNKKLQNIFAGRKEVWRRKESVIKMTLTVVVPAIRWSSRRKQWCDSTRDHFFFF